MWASTSTLLGYQRYQFNIVLPVKRANYKSKSHLKLLYFIYIHYIRFIHMFVSSAMDPDYELSDSVREEANKRREKGTQTNKPEISLKQITITSIYRKVRTD